MIYGIGIDIIEVERIRSISEKNPKFLTRIFTETEIAYCSKKKNKYQHFAARFATKEAFFKAIGRAIPWNDVGITNLPSGKPVLEILSKENFSFQKTDVSLSHIKDYAIATVLLST
jgi:holo-[acyl-carrier protein] synthase